MSGEWHSAALASLRALAKDLLDTEIRSCHASGGAFFWVGPVGLWLRGARPEGGKMNAATVIRGVLRPLRESTNPAVPLASVRKLLGRGRKRHERFLHAGGVHYDAGLLRWLLDGLPDGEARIVAHDVVCGMRALILGTKDWVAAIGPYRANEDQKAGAKRIEDLGIEVAGGVPSG